MALLSPSVRLVNVGEEAGKGGQSMAETAALLSGDPLLNYRGYVEGDGIFEGSTDVVVCDGFAGNVALKTSEGLATMINGMFKELLRGSWTGPNWCGLYAHSVAGFKVSTGSSLI